MDESKEYIQMCEQATEIQTIWKNTYPAMKDGAVYIPKKPTADSIWLPRQDELQDILKAFFCTPIEAKPKGEGKPTFHIPILELWIHEFFDDASCFAWPGWTANLAKDSMEQLWLGFVMHKLYNKVWRSGWEAA